MKAKTFEIRDRSTTIMVVATPTVSQNAAESFAFRREGYHKDSHFILVTCIHNLYTEYDPFKWPDRTMKQAHLHIEKNFNELESGSVIDIEYILGEVKEPKISERLTREVE